MLTCDVIIPIAPHHTAIAERAIASAHAQTVACSVQAMVDQDERGPAWVRNQLTSRSAADFVVYLDADDWLDPRFVEQCLMVWQPGSYVYTDWHAGDAVVTAPPKPWCEGDWHVLTTLVPTPIAQAHPFDETLPGAEDTDFFWQLTRHGVRPVHLPQALFHYGANGKRSSAFVNSDQYAIVMHTIRQRYRHLTGYCADTEPANRPFDGAVECVALWSGNRQQRGSISGHLYARAGNGRRMWVDRRDVDAHPEYWHIIQGGRRVSQPAQPLHGVNAIAEALNYSRISEPQDIPVIVPDATIEPDIREILKRI